MERPHVYVGKDAGPHAHRTGGFDPTSATDDATGVAADRGVGATDLSRAQHRVGTRIRVFAGDENAGEVRRATAQWFQRLLRSDLRGVHEIAVIGKPVTEPGHHTSASSFPRDRASLQPPDGL